MALTISAPQSNISEQCTHALVAYLPYFCSLSFSDMTSNLWAGAQKYWGISLLQFWLQMGYLSAEMYQIWNIYVDVGPV